MTPSILGTFIKFTGSMDDLLVNCPNLLKRPINNKVLASLGAKFSGKVTGGADPPIRKTSVCSLDEVRRKEETESLNRVLSSPSLKSPVRTPVTENDPLGAFCLAKSFDTPSDSTTGDENGELAAHKKLPGLEGVRNVSSEIELDCKGTPILFDRRKEKWDAKRRSSAGVLHRSMSSGMDREENGVDGEEDDEADSRLKELDAAAGETTVSRASTLPADDRDRSSSQSGVSSGDHGSPFRTGLGNFKLPFR